MAAKEASRQAGLVEEASQMAAGVDTRSSHLARLCGLLQANTWQHGSPRLSSGVAGRGHEWHQQRRPCLPVHGLHFTSLHLYGPCSSRLSQGYLPAWGPIKAGTQLVCPNAHRLFRPACPLPLPPLPQVASLMAESKDFNNFVADPSVPRETKVDGLNSILTKMGATDVTKNFVGAPQWPGHAVP